MQQQQNAAKKAITVSTISGIHIPISTAIRLINTTQHAVLVGGLGSNDYVLDKVSSALLPTGLNITRPESHVYVFLSRALNFFYTPLT